MGSKLFSKANAAAIATRRASARQQDGEANVSSIAKQRMLDNQHEHSQQELH
jgi:hypothetical protein